MFKDKYQIEKTVSERSNTIVFKGRRISDNLPVIIKTLREDYPTQNDILKFRYEYEMLKEVNIDGVIKMYEIINFNNSFAIIEEYFNGDSLDECTNMSLTDKIYLFIKISEIIEKIHNLEIIHKDINPNNILINRSTNEIRILDFGLSVKLSKESQEIKILDVLEGTISYISPEQTGRVNRSIDFRSDYYSLGATFYKIFTGETLFPNAIDAMETVHCHIAKQPSPPHLINPTLPITLSKIILKLLKKDPENRYQSIYGLLYDLKKLLKNIKENKGNINFKIGEKDKHTIFQIPEKLYGREKEKKELINCIDNVSSGFSEIVLISGYSGIGKSSLVNEVHKSISKNNCYFISGKFDQFQKDISYSALIKAFKKLIQLSLGENEYKLDKIKKRLKTSLGDNGSIISSVIPEIELLIGKQKQVEQLSSIETQNRFNLVFEKFIKVFADKSHPLIIFLDDIQWIDSATLNLLKIILKDIKLKYFLFIGVYRNNEIFLSHPLNILIENLRNEININKFILKPLVKKNIDQLLSDTFNTNISEIEELSQLVFKKTAGNPFFTKEFLNTLYKENFIFFDIKKNNWKWNIEKIKEQNLSNNVVEFMLKNLKKLPENTQKILNIGAFLGNQFDLRTLSYITEKSLKKIALDLWPAVKEGFIIPLGNDHKIIYTSSEEILNSSTKLSTIKIIDKFSHDRVQQAAYELTPKENRNRVHLKIARILLKHYEKHDSVNKNIFSILEHFNQGKKFITSRQEKVKLAELNFIASKQERQSNAYKIAATHSNIGIQMLGKNAWKENYKLIYNLFLENTEAQYLDRNFDCTEKNLEILLKNSKDRDDRYKIYKIMLLYFNSINKFKENIDIGIKLLAEWGINFPKQNNKVKINKQFDIEYKKYNDLLKKHKINDLSNLNKIVSDEKKICIEILEKMIDAAYLGNPYILKLIILTQVNLSIQYGNSEASPSGYVWWGTILTTEQQFNSGYNFGKIAIELTKNNHNSLINCRVYHMFGGFIQFWKEHVSYSISTLSKAFSLGNDSGDINYSNYAQAISGRYIFYKGNKLKKVKKDAEICLNFMEKTSHSGMLEFYNSMYYTILSLLDETKDKYMLNKDLNLEKQKLNEWHEKKLNLQIALYYILKVFLHYIYGDYKTAVIFNKKAEKYLPWISPQFDIIQLLFYSTLSKIAVYRNIPQKEQKKYLEEINESIKKMYNFSITATNNCKNKLYLLRAEKYRVLNKRTSAITFYEKALLLSKKNLFLHEEALTNELYGKFWLEYKNERLSKIFINEAIFKYDQWGAYRKVISMEETYFSLLENKVFFSSLTKFNCCQNSALSGTTKQEVLDMNTLIKASQILSKEIKKMNLIKKMMNLVIENAGAERGVFINKEGQYEFILVEADTKTENILNKKTKLSEYNNLLKSTVYYVLNSEKYIVVENAEKDSKYFLNDYVKDNNIKSVLCYPIISKEKIIGLIYLENNIVPGVFDESRIEVLNILSAQLAISLENAFFYEKLETKVEERTIELFKKNDLLRLKNIELEKLSTTDQLTGIYNRRYLEHELNKELSMCKRYNKKIAVIILDIDHFKKVNDNYGHSIGDEILIKVSDTIKVNLRESDTFGRWGGEEFLVLLPECSDAYTVAEKIRISLENINHHIVKRITASIGLTYYESGDTLSSIITRADSGLYFAKKNGRNKVKEINSFI